MNRTAPMKSKLHHQINTEERIDKPKRPLSAYNFFFQNERRIMLGHDFIKKEDRTFPKRRVHRKTHGKIGFGEMARVIAKKWKSLDDETRSQFEDQAEADRRRYKQEMNMWGQRQNQVQRQYQEVKEKLQQQQQQEKNAWKQAIACNKPNKKNSYNGSVGSSNNENNNIVIPNNLRQGCCAESTVQFQVLKATGHLREPMAQSNKTEIHNLLLPKRHSTSSGGIINHACHTSSRNAARSVAVVSALDSDSTFLRNLSDSVDTDVAAALRVLGSQQIQREKAKEILEYQMLKIESWKKSRILEHALNAPGQNYATHFRNDYLPHLSPQATPTFKGSMHSDTRALGLAIRLGFLGPLRL